jgi:hypothetical protein
MRTYTWVDVLPLGITIGKQGTRSCTVGVEIKVEELE